MTFRGSGMPHVAVACVLALVCVTPCAAAKRAPRPVPVIAPAVSPALPVEMTLREDSTSAERSALQRAAFEHARRDFAAVVAVLSPLALESGPRTPEPDRAAFLLAHALLQLGQRERFDRLASGVSAWATESPFTRWIVREYRSFGATGPSQAGATVADAIAASRLLGAGEPERVLKLLPARGTRDALLLHLRAEALSMLGRDASSEWESLARADSVAGLARDLAGHAALRLAQRTAEKGGDPRPQLARVPPGSRYASRARHMAALATLERGDTVSARATLEALLRADSTYSGRREVLRTLGRLAMDASDWDRAYELHLQADHDWQFARTRLRQGKEPAAADSLWLQWRNDGSLSGTLVLDALTSSALAERLEREAGDLTRRPAEGEAAWALPPAPRESLVPPPPGEDWERVRRADEEAATARGSLALARDSLARERARLAAARRYFGLGLADLQRQSAGLVRRSHLLDSLHSGMDGTASRLLQLRDDASLHLQRRAAAVLARVEAQERWIHAMDHLYLQGPDAERQAATPPLHKGPDVVLAQERELAQGVRFAAQRMLQDLPRRMMVSYERWWGPRLMDRAGALAPGARATLERARAMGRSLDSSLAAAGASRESQRLATRVGSLEREAERSTARASATRADVSRAAVERALVALETEREATDYGLAASAWARAVRLSAADSLPGAARVSDAKRADDPFAAEQDSARMQEREEAIARVSVFLADHAGSPARGEMRFRLADLLVTQARAEFRTRMTDWLAAQSQGRQAPLPVVDHAQAIELYRRILAEDGSLPHRDAVLYNAGLLLADAGDTEAVPMFRRLLADHPNSAYAQEASLRLGDFAFDAGRLDEGVSHYAKAASGGDPTLTAIALYKSGWAHYNAGRFGPAADAFRGVMDLYAGDARARVQADLEHEAEQYFVNSLAASGGAPAFAKAFPAGRERPYERRVLRAMSLHLRRYGEFQDAAAADRLYLERWPSDPAALDVVTGLAETQRKAERPAEERATRLTWASRFAPGGEWAHAQSSDSLRRAGEAFARSAWRDEALEHHRLARRSGSSEEWREALRHYELLLARWPQDDARATHELHAGEACAELGEYPAALAHYRRAAVQGRDSVASRAAWQVVAVTDRWYESTRPGGGRGARKGIGRDSLARAVISEAETLLAREPRHPQAAELVWRGAQLSLAHGWEAEAQAALGHFARDFPADARAPLAAHERAQSLFRRGDHAAAGAAFEEALAAARRGGADSLARRAEAALPVCAYRAAEDLVSSDSTAHVRHAEAFAEVAKRWPAFESAPVAQYRAGLAWIEGGRTADGVRALGVLAERWPAHALARESRVRSAQAWEAAGEHERAATAWVEFSERHPKDAEADEAWLRAADLCDSAGLVPRGDQLRARYLQRWPGDEDASLEILERLARHELAALPEGRSVSTLLTVPKAQGKALAKPAPYLAQYMKRVAKTPAVASKPLLAEVRFRGAEETFETYRTVRLTQPLPPSIAAKQRLLDSVLVRYRRTVDLGVPQWAHAATYRIGEALVGFGEALENSERPADLTGDDLKGYENVLLEQAMNFHSQGESVWSDLLRRTNGTTPDPWTTRTRTALWSRLGDRFLFVAEGEVPLVGDTAGRDAPRAKEAKP